MRFYVLRTTVLLLAVLSISPLLAQEKPKNLETKALTKLGRAATAYVEVPLPGGKGLTSGSAFCVHASGVFVTNHHVIKDANDNIRVVLNASTADQKILTAKVLRSDAAEDLALLQVNEKGDYTPLELGTVDDLSELQTVISFGFPFGNRLAVTDKDYASITINQLKVSSLRNRDRKLYRIQLDGSLNPGTSGGPVVDETGRVIGVVVSGLRGTGLAEAIPVSLVRPLLEKPALATTYPTLTSKDQGQESLFATTVATFVPVGKMEAELQIKVAGQTTTVPMTANGSTFTAKVVALPAAKTDKLKAVVTVDEVALPMTIDALTFKVGMKNVELAQVNQIDFAGQGEVTLSDGTKVAGPITGLREVTTTIAGQTLTFGLNKASKVVFAPRTVPGEVACIVIVKMDGKEVGREERTLSVSGGTVASVGGAATPKAPTLTSDKVEVQLPSTTDLFCVGGSGRYILMRLPRERKLAIFDVTAAKIVKYLPLAEENALIAAGHEKLFVVLTKSNAIQRYDLTTFEKELTAPVTIKGSVHFALMGSASRGPLILINAEQHIRELVLFDTNLKKIELKGDFDYRRHRLNADSWPRVSADGQTITWWGQGSPGGFNIATVRETEILAKSTGISVGHLTPSPDGKIIYTSRGAFSPEGKSLSGASPEDLSNENYFVPSIHGRYFVKLPINGPHNRDKAKLPPTVHMEGDSRPLLTLKDVALPFEVNAWDRDRIGADQRVLLIPSAKLLIVIPEANDRLVLYKLDIDAALEASGIDYLFVTSLAPSAAERGTSYSHSITVKAKKGGVKYKLESGPDGMKVDTTGKLTWDVPSGFVGTTTSVLLTISDAAGQEIFHSFTLEVITKK